MFLVLELYYKLAQKSLSYSRIYLHYLHFCFAFSANKGYNTCKKQQIDHIFLYLV